MTPQQNDWSGWVRCDTLYTPDQRYTDRLLRVKNGKIERMLHAEEGANIPEQEIVYEHDAIVAPGFIELHVHGARGHDVMDGSLEALESISSALAAHGTTSFLATTLSAPDSDTEAALRGFAAHQANVATGAHPIGVHMEGPYLNPIRRGTHNSSYLRAADIESFRRFVTIARGAVRKITIAPEMDPGLQLVREAASLGIRISIGHSDATAEQARDAIDAGATQATHTFNAMRPFHQREPGILGQVLTDERVFTEVIADGVHVHPTALELLWRIKGPERTLLVSDGLSAVDMPDGRYPLGDKMITVERGECRDPDGTLAGSTLTLDRAVRNLVQWFDVPLHEALISASATPARSMGLAGIKGVIAPGADADLVFLDSELNVVKTMVAGRIVYSRIRERNPR